MTEEQRDNNNNKTKCETFNGDTPTGKTGNCGICETSQLNLVKQLVLHSLHSRAPNKVPLLIELSSQTRQKH